MKVIDNIVFILVGMLVGKHIRKLDMTEVYYYLIWKWYHIRHIKCDICHTSKIGGDNPIYHYSICENCAYDYKIPEVYNA